MKKLTTALSALILLFVCEAVFAEIKVIETDSSYVLGDSDSRIEARKIAVQEAKRKSLEEAGTYIESISEVKNMALVKDEIRAYTAGVVETEIVSEEMRGTAANPEIYIRTRCKINTDELLAHIKRFRENEDMKEQLMAASKENEALKNERDELMRRLGAEKDKTRSDDIRKKLDTVIEKEESNSEVTKVWTRVSYKVDMGDPRDNANFGRKEMDSIVPLLIKALRVNPDNQRARLLLAAIYHKKGDNVDAERELRSSVAANPANLMSLGLFYKKNGRYAEALTTFRALHKQRPDKPEPLFQMGMTYHDTGDCREAVNSLKRFLYLTQNNERFSRQKATANKAVRDCSADNRKHKREIKQDRQFKKKDRFRFESR
ncbi:MAG: tetratricopeptide repeat protein [Nitrospirae bacterium]|nr:MAG: tetratricopeptide repeat protein [Nitrospirota bacterium]